MLSIFRFFPVVACMLALTAAGCSTVSSSADGAPPGVDAAASISGADLVWPPSPEPARIRYLFSLARPEDIGWSPSIFEKVFSLIAGRKEGRDIVRPYGICMTPNEVLYVADPGLGLVHQYDMKNHRYAQITRYGDQDIISPIGVATDGQQRLYVSDSARRRVFVFGPKFKPLMEIGSREDLQRPTGLAVHAASGRLYVADTKAHVVKAFSLQGEPLFVIGGRGTADGRFNFPTSLTVDAEGRIFVNDSMNFRIQVFNPDGAFLYKFGQHGDGSGEMSQPKGVALDSEGHVYVADAIFDSIQIFNPDGALMLFFGQSGQGPGKFWIPTAVYIDTKNRIYVADSFNQRVQVFQFLGGNPL